MKPISAPAVLASNQLSQVSTKKQKDEPMPVMHKNNKLEDLTRGQILRKLFLSTLYISAFTFGGGFVIITFMKRKFVDELHWAEEDELLDLTAIAESCPGAIAVNAAILIGWHIQGLLGMLVAVLGTLIPPVCIISLISLCYSAFASNVLVALVLKGMQVGVAAVILDVVCGLGKHVLKERSTVHNVVMVVAFIATCVFHVSVIAVILSAAVVGIMTALFAKPNKETKKK